MRPESVGQAKLKVVSETGIVDIISLMKDVLEVENVCQSSPSQIETVPSAPDFDFTFEEEFRTYELLVRKEHLVDGIFDISLQIPNFLGTWKDFLLSQSFGKSMTKEYRNLVDIRNEAVLSIQTDGLILLSLDMFNEFKNVDQSVKFETMGFSCIVLHIFNR